MIQMAPVALLALAVLVPQCSGTVWGNVLLLFIVFGIFLGTITLNQGQGSKNLESVTNNEP